MEDTSAQGTPIPEQSLIVPGYDYTALDMDTAESLKARGARIRAMKNRAAWEMGQELKAAQDELAHQGDGTFQKWAEAETGMSRGTVYNLINVYQALGDHPNLERINMTLTAQYALAAPSTPADVRDTIIERAEAGEHITTADVKDALQTRTAKDAERIVAYLTARHNGPLSWRPIMEGSQITRLDDFTKAINLLEAEGRLTHQIHAAGKMFTLVVPPADPEPPPADNDDGIPADLRAAFDHATITLLGRTDDGAWHRAIEIGRKLVAANLWDGSTRIEFDAYTLHDKLFGANRDFVGDPVPGVDFIFVDVPQTAATPIAESDTPAALILAALHRTDGSLTLPEIAESIFRETGAHLTVAALSDANAELVAAGEVLGPSAFDGKGWRLYSLAERAAVPFKTPFPVEGETAVGEPESAAPTGVITFKPRTIPASLYLHSSVDFIKSSLKFDGLGRQQLQLLLDTERSSASPRRSLINWLEQLIPSAGDEPAPLIRFEEETPQAVENAESESPAPAAQEPERDDRPARPAVPSDADLSALLAALAGVTETELRANWHGEEIEPTPAQAALVVQGKIRPVHKWSSGSKWLVGYVLFDAPRTDERNGKAAESDAMPALTALESALTEAHAAIRIALRTPAPDWAAVPADRREPLHRLMRDVFNDADKLCERLVETGVALNSSEPVSIGA